MPPPPAEDTFFYQFFGVDKFRIDWIKTVKQPDVNLELRMHQLKIKNAVGCESSGEK